MFVVLFCLFIATLWSLAGKGLTSWLSCELCFLIFLSLSHGVLGQFWFLIVSIPDLCLFTSFMDSHSIPYGLITLYGRLISILSSDVLSLLDLSNLSCE